MQNTDDFPIFSGASPKQVLDDLTPLIEFRNEGISLEELDVMIQERLLPHLMRYDHPNFLSMFNVFPEKGAKLGAEIALTYNQGVTNWYVSPGGAMIEEMCIKAVCKLFGFDEHADGTFMYSGTYANQQAVYMALHWKAEQAGFNFAEEGILGFDDPQRLLVLTSEDAHFSLKHAIRMIGLGDKNLISLAVDEQRRIDCTKMKETVDELQTDYDIFCVAATTGTTSTGSIDPVASMFDICQNIGAWLHVDGAYGLAYYLVPEYKQRFSGIELADSVSWDPHKQFGIPIPNSILFAKRKEDFHRMSLRSDYLYREGETKPSPGLKSPPSTRPLSALSLVTSIRYQGMDKIRGGLRAPLLAMQTLYQKLKDDPEFELLHQPDTGILCFRVKSVKIQESEMNAFQKKIYDEVIAKAKHSISFTKLDGRAVLRLVSVSSTITGEIVRDVIEDIRRVAHEITQEHKNENIDYKSQ